MSEKQEKKIICRDCGKEFTLTVGEQNFYEEKGFAEPVRCKECRDRRKAERENQSTSQEETPKNDFEEMLEKFKANTVLFEIMIVSIDHDLCNRLILDQFLQNIQLTERIKKFLPKRRLFFERNELFF